MIIGIVSVISSDTPCRDSNVWFTRNHKEIHRNKYLTHFRCYSGITMLSLHVWSLTITLTVPLFNLGDGVFYNLYVVGSVLILRLIICQRQCSANTHWTLIVLISRGKMPGDIFCRIPPHLFFRKFEIKIVASFILLET